MKRWLVNLKGGEVITVRLAALQNPANMGSEYIGGRGDYAFVRAKQLVAEAKP